MRDLNPRTPPVNVAAGSRRASLLVVLSPFQPCSTLAESVRSRLPTLTNKLGPIDASDLQITLHLNTEDGPMFDLENLLSDVLPDPKDTVYAVIEVSLLSNPHFILQSLEKWELVLLQRHRESIPSPPQQAIGNAPTSRIRVITPETAQSDITTIALLPKRVPTSCRLKQLKGRVQEHLGFSAKDGDCPALKCNCRLVRQIDNHASFNIHGIGD